MVSRPTERGEPVSSDSTARASRAAGGPPCWLSGLQGPAVVGSGRRVSRPVSEVPWVT